MWPAAMGAGSAAQSLASARAAPSSSRTYHADVGAAGTADTLLDAASYNRSLWALLLPAPAAGVAGPGHSSRAPPARLGAASLSLVGGSSQLPARDRAVNGHSHRMFFRCLPLWQQLFSASLASKGACSRLESRAEATYVFAESYHPVSPGLCYCPIVAPAPPLKSVRQRNT